MTNQDLVLNIAVNLGRLGRWSYEGKTSRILQFLVDTQTYVDKLKNTSPRFGSTYKNFLKNYSYLKSTSPNNHDWAETAFTWASILTHRAKYA